MEGGPTVKLEKFHIPSSIGATLFLGLYLICGCNSSHATQQHPDEVDSVVRALTTNGFGALNVSQDRTKGVMTLTGPVQSQERKTYAEQIARVNASDYVIANEITVTPPPPTEDQLTEDKYKAVLQAHQALDLHDIHYEAKNGTLILSGSVHTALQRAEAVKLAKEVPNVERVVDQIKVKP
jgi:hyperosmotically inducible periplasmic protein